MKKLILFVSFIAFAVMCYGQLTIDNLTLPVRTTLVSVYPEIVAKNSDGSYYYPITINKIGDLYDIQFQTTGPYKWPGWKLDVNSYITIKSDGGLVKYSKYIANTMNLPAKLKTYLIQKHRCQLYGVGTVGGTIFAARKIMTESVQWLCTFKNWSWVRLTDTPNQINAAGQVPVPAPVYLKSYPWVEPTPY